MAKKQAQDVEQEFVGTEQEQEFSNEVEAGEGAPTAEEAAAEAQDVRVWEVDGKPVTKSEFIRHQFTVNNLSRKQIAEQFDINYRTVYGATVNMVNAAEPSTRGRSASSSKIQITADGKVVTTLEGVTYLDGEAVEEGAELGELTEVDRNQWIKDQVAAGRERGTIATVLGISYGVVYQLTKDAVGTKQRHEIQHGDELVSRSEYIRRRHAEGASKSEIAKELGVDYPVVWSALKSTKSDADKFAEVVDKLAKFGDNAVDAAAFATLVEQLRAVEFKAEEAAVEVEEAVPVIEDETGTDSVYAAAE